MYYRTVAIAATLAHSQAMTINCSLNDSLNHQLYLAPSDTALVPGKPARIAGGSFADWISDLVDWYCRDESDMERDRR